MLSPGSGRVHPHFAQRVRGHPRWRRPRQRRTSWV